jgi:hypothetical protein
VDKCVWGAEFFSALFHGHPCPSHPTPPILQIRKQVQQEVLAKVPHFLSSPVGRAGKENPRLVGVGRGLSYFIGQQAASEGLTGGWG